MHVHCCCVAVSSRCNPACLLPFARTQPQFTDSSSSVADSQSHQRPDTQRLLCISALDSIQICIVELAHAPLLSSHHQICRVPDMLHACRAAKQTPSGPNPSAAAAAAGGSAGARGQPQPPIGVLSPEAIRDKVKTALIRLANNDAFVDSLAQELKTVGLLQ